MNKVSGNKEYIEQNIKERSDSKRDTFTLLLSVLDVCFYLILCFLYVSRSF